MRCFFSLLGVIQCVWFADHLFRIKRLLMFVLRRGEPDLPEYRMAPLIFHVQQQTRAAPLASPGQPCVSVPAYERTEVFLSAHKPLPVSARLHKRTHAHAPLSRRRLCFCARSGSGAPLVNSSCHVETLAWHCSPLVLHGEQRARPATSCAVRAAGILLISGLEPL